MADNKSKTDLSKAPVTSDKGKVSTKDLGFNTSDHRDATTHDRDEEAKDALEATPDKEVTGIAAVENAVQPDGTVPTFIDPKTYEPGYHPGPPQHWTYPYPNIEVEAQNQIDSKRAKAIEIAEAESRAAALKAHMQTIEREVRKREKLEEARSKWQADWEAEQTRIERETK